MTGGCWVVVRLKKLPRSFLKRYQNVIEKVIQIKSDGKKILGFGKNDLNILIHISFPDIKVRGVGDLFL